MTPDFVVDNNARTSGTSLQDYTERYSYDQIVAVLGPHNDNSDGYKVSTEWTLTEMATGNAVTLYDYKATSLYDDGYPSPEHFRSDPEGYEWHIGAHDKETAQRFLVWLTAAVEANVKPTRWTVADGRCLVYNGTPIFTMHKIGDDSLGYTMDACDMDDLARALPEALNRAYVVPTISPVHAHRVTERWNRGGAR